MGTCLYTVIIEEDLDRCQVAISGRAARIQGAVDRCHHAGGGRKWSRHRRAGSGQVAAAIGLGVARGRALGGDGELIAAGKKAVGMAASLTDQEYAGGDIRLEDAEIADAQWFGVDPARVLNETNHGKKAKDSLSVFSKNRQALIEMDEKELRRMEEDFGRQASVLSATAKKEREDQFRRRVAEYQQKAGEMNREVQEKQKDVLEGFREKVGLIVGKVSKRLGLQVVIDKGKGGPTLYSDEGLDITGQVIDEFNREYP